MSEKKKKVFISGPMTGIKDFNKPAFDRAEQWLTQAGYSVFNPARMHFDDTWTHEEIMRIDLAALAQCDYILMLDGWRTSKGATHEYLYAMATGIELMPKRESNLKSRIEIETFGDISGRNLDFLLWFEKHCNEVLAKGGALTGDIDTVLDNLTYYICNELPKKSCAGCKYFMFSINEEPCKFCNPVLHTNFEPKDAEK